MQTNNNPPIWKLFLLFFLIGIIGTSIYYATTGYFIEVLETLAIICFGIGVSLVLVYVLSKEAFLWLIGQRSEYYRLLQATKTLSSKVANTAITWLPLGLKRVEKQRLKKDVPMFIEMQMMRRINQTIMQVFIAAFGAAFALLGTVVLMQQNEKIEVQTQLMEAERRSSLVFLFSNVMDAIDSELKIIPPNKIDGYGNDTIRNLSPQLVGRIIALSTRLKPYRYLDTDTLITKPLSPERGQLLLNLVESKLAVTTYDAIFRKANFSCADLEEIEFDNGIYLQGINLFSANLRNTDLRNADLFNADLRNVDLRNVDLRQAKLSNAKLNNADLRNTMLGYTDFWYVDLREADLKYADLRHADLREADLKSADLRYANLVNADLLNTNLHNAIVSKKFLKHGRVKNIKQLQQEYKETPHLDKPSRYSILKNPKKKINESYQDIY